MCYSEMKLDHSRLRYPTVFCLAPPTRKLLKFTIVSMPIWTFCLPFFGFSYIPGNSAFILGLPLPIGAAFLMVCAFLVLVWALCSRIVIYNQQFIAPFRLLNGLPLRSLQKVTLSPDDAATARHLVFTFENPNGKTQTEKIKLSSLDSTSMTKLLGLMEKMAPQCKISLKALDYFSNKQLILQRNLSAHMVYRSNNWLGRFRDAFNSKRTPILVVWCTFWGAVLVLLSPLISVAAMSTAAHLIGGSYVETGWLADYCSFVKDWVSAYVGRPCTSVSDTVRVAGVGQYFMILAGAVVGAFFWFSRFAPNTLRLSPDSLSLYSNHFGNTFNEKSINWVDVKTVKLVKHKGSSQSWEIHFFNEDRESTKPDLMLKVAAIGAGEQQALIRAIEQYAPTARIDASLLELLQTDHAASYTELWLQSLSSAPKRERLAPLQETQSLQSGRYRIVRQLAVGGQGTAYLAVDATSRGATAQVVLKEFVLPVYVDKEVRKQALEKFQRESQMLQELRNPRIVQLLSYFVEDHRAYLVLEHIDGVSLRTLVEEQGALCEEQVMELALQMCSILEYLHGLEPPLIHRDFTPDNLILQGDGQLKLIDFDVARRDAGSKTSVVGKHSFIPPEQFRGRPSVQSDLYALGATLHYLLTGDDPEPLTRSSPFQSGALVSQAFDAVVMRATELELENRFHSACEVRSALSSSQTINIGDTAHSVASVVVRGTGDAC